MKPIPSLSLIFFIVCSCAPTLAGTEIQKGFVEILAGNWKRMRKREEHREKIKTQIHSHFSIHRPILGRLVKNRSFFRFYLLFEPMIVALLPRPALDLTTGFSKKDARYLKIESNFKSFTFLTSLYSATIFSNWFFQKLHKQN